MQFNVALLKQQHAEIRSAATKLSHLLEGSFEDTGPMFGVARRSVAHLISTHLKTEQEELLTPLCTHKLTLRIPGFIEIAVQTRDLRLAYSAHVSTWHSRAIKADWLGYTASAHQLRSALEQLIKREEEEIFPVAQRLLSALR